MSEQNVSVKVNTEGKNIVIAYLLWWFLGCLGVHRFYLGRVGSGIAQLLLTVFGYLTIFILIGWAFLLIWFVWWAFDAYFTYKMVQEENDKLGVSTATFSVSKSGGFYNELDQLEKLHSLYEKGVITKEEYEKKKAEFI